MGRVAVPVLLVATATFCSTPMANLFAVPVRRWNAGRSGLVAPMDFNICSVDTKRICLMRQTLFRCVVQDQTPVIGYNNPAQAHAHLIAGVVNLGLPMAQAPPALRGCWPLRTAITVLRRLASCLRGCGPRTVNAISLHGRLSVPKVRAFVDFAMTMPLNRNVQECLPSNEYWRPPRPAVAFRSAAAFRHTAGVVDDKTRNSGHSTGTQWKTLPGE